jgi:hypothetical protein
LGGSADALLNIYQQVMSGKAGFNLSSEDELQLVEGLRYNYVQWNILRIYVLVHFFRSSFVCFPSRVPLL